MQEAKDVIDGLIDAEIRNGDLLTLDFDRVVGEVETEVGVSRSMAEQYVRTYAEVSKHGQKRVVIGMDGEDTSDRAQALKDGEGDDAAAETAEATTKATAASPTSTAEATPDLDSEEVEFDDAGDNVKAAELTMPVGDRTGDYFGQNDDGKGGLAVLEDVGHPLTPEVEHSYLRREQAGGTTDIENITAFMEDPDAATLLVGETGTGKDFAIKYICARTNRPMIRVNFGVGVRYEDLVGGFEPRTAEASEVFPEIKRYAEEYDVSVEEAINIYGLSSQFEFVPGVLYMAVKHGWVFVADEINAAGGEATMPLHGVTEDSDSRELVVRQTGEVIKPHPEFRFVGTMNPPTYAGTKPLNDAFRTRFWPVRMDYLPPEGEGQLMAEACTVMDRETGEEEPVFENVDMQNVRAEFKDSVSGAPQTDDEINITRLCDLLAQLRDAYKAGDNITPISHREAIKIGKLSDRMGMKAAAKYVLGNIAQPEDKSAIQKTVETTKFAE